jgi:hypothetical protein
MTTRALTLAMCAGERRLSSPAARAATATFSANDQNGLGLTVTREGGASPAARTSPCTPSLTSPRSVALLPPLDGIDLGFGEDLGDDPVAIDIDIDLDREQSSHEPVSLTRPDHTVRAPAAAATPHVRRWWRTLLGHAKARRETHGDVAVLRAMDVGADLCRVVSQILASVLLPTPTHGTSSVNPGTQRHPWDFPLPISTHCRDEKGPLSW